MTNYLKVTANYLEGFEHQLNLDLGRISQSTTVNDRRLYTYLFTYIYFVDYFSKINEVNVSDFVLGKAISYSLMPTTLNLRDSNIEALLPCLNKLKKDGKRLDSEELLKLRFVVNNSIVGASKLLHFINPNVYPIWDSRIDRFINGDSLNTNNMERFFAYLATFDRVAAEAKFISIQQSISDKLGYSVSKARAFEMVMYLADLKQLEFISIQGPQASQAVVPQLRSVTIPQYKRDEYTFISNLGPVTIDLAYPNTLFRNGYLLSERYSSNANLELAAIAKRRRKLLISDNGNWTRMSEIARHFNNSGNDILAKARNELSNYGVLSQSTLNERLALMDEIGEYCSQVIDDLHWPQIIEAQLRMSPNYMIGMEDFTIPVLMMVGVLDPIFSPDSSEIAKYQKRTNSLLSSQINGEYGYLNELNNIGMFLVIHAFDYKSAFDGGMFAREIKKDGLAISYGAPMSSNKWIDKIELGDKVEVFDEKLPESYIIAHAITIGVANGHKGDIPFHILGVGTPILIMMIGFLLKQSKAVSIDSSAPLKDAFDGVIYGSRQAYIKMKMYKVAARALIDNKPYESTTPFFLDFNRKYPDDWTSLRNELGITQETKESELESTLRARQDLVRKFIPFFTILTSRDDPFYWSLRIARAGHNYCVLREIVDHIRNRRNNWPALRAWTENEINRYAEVGSSRWAKAVKKCYEITKEHRLIE